ncbi:bZIP transcription factor [Purpureocillium lavendulum]|uniref:BZIP transcription factor n=1 Tax=Purpureocillium lavendulum TaxID=1247861 RepID=A0AB34FPT6_9HYPO|nr:bZIP transcription factor [Purpureocillium lavendulum]
MGSPDLGRWEGGRWGGAARMPAGQQAMVPIQRTLGRQPAVLIAGRLPYPLPAARWPARCPNFHSPVRRRPDQPPTRKPTTYNHHRRHLAVSSRRPSGSMPPLLAMSPETSQSPSEPSPPGPTVNNNGSNAGGGRGSSGNGNGNGKPPPAKRARTDAQMAQKRKADRLKHRVNRAESKTRLENIERDVAFLSSSVGDLLSQLRIVRRADPAVAASVLGPRPCVSSADGTDPMTDAPPPSSSASAATSAAAAAAAASGLSSSSSSGADALSNPWFKAMMDTPVSGGFPQFLSTQASPSSMGSTPPPPAVVECRCGVEHTDRTDCLELKSFMILYQAHIALSQDPNFAISIPRNPSLANLMLHSITDNPLTMIMGSTLRQFEVQNTETLFGLYFLCYRLLRWRLYPNPESFNDVPDLIRPSRVQNSILHPVSIDYMPWPRLRDFLCLNQNRDSRHSVDLYIRSIQLRWPADKQLLCRSPIGDIQLNPEFESVISDIRYWHLGPPWSDAFPSLRKYVE